jgi:hypothetical protein
MLYGRGSKGLSSVRSLVPSRCLKIDSMRVWSWGRDVFSFPICPKGSFKGIHFLVFSHRG